MKAAQLMRDHGWLVLLAIFPTCSFAGLAALLRSEQPLTRRAIASSILNSGCLGVATAALMMHQFGNEAMHLIIGISILSGLGGNTAVDFVLQMARAWIKHREDDYE